MGLEMELRHLRYFVAVAETASLSLAAKSKLHTSQPSLSRQIRDLEEEIGAQLITRTARGVALTPAGRAFLDHARGILLQVDAAAEAARRAVHPAKPCFSMGFLTGHEVTWMPEALRILRDELPNIDVMISSQYSPLLAEDLSKGKIDAAFLRKERALPDLVFRLLVKEPLVVILPSDHRLAALKAISPRELAGETFVIVSHTAPVLRAVIDNYLKRSRINITPAHEADHVTMGNFPDNVNARTRTVTCLRAELSPCLCNESPSEGRCANCRSGPRLQKVEPVSDPQAFAFKTGRVGRSCVEKTDPITLEMHPSK
jgi:LysR family transcriptional regulator, hca operon transcriptional activator